jgi:circadian clock protein KaiB
LSNAPEYQLVLFVTGASPNSVRAITNLKIICDQFLQGRYELEVIDVYQNPELARKEQIIAVPTLVKRRPYPIKRLVGDMSDISKVTKGLGIIISNINDE